MSSRPERKVPIQRSESSLIDAEFNSIRERFEKDMKNMEEEMNRFRTHLMDRERDFFGSSMVTSSQHKSSHSSSTSEKDGQLTWLDDLNSPLVQDSEDGKVLKLRFDVTQYAPEEIVVKTIDNRLQVHAKHEEKSENRQVFREYNREFLLPKGINPEMIRSSLSKDGVLTVEAPLPAIEGPKERQIPVMHK